MEISTRPILLVIDGFDLLYFEIRPVDFHFYEIQIILPIKLETNQKAIRRKKNIIRTINTFKITIFNKNSVWHVIKVIKNIR